MSSAPIETTLELWASSLRDVKARMRPLFGDVRVASSANRFLDGLLSAERRKTGWMRAEAAGDPGPWRHQAVLGRSHWDAEALVAIVRDNVLENLADPDAVLVIGETGFLKQGKASCGVGRDAASPSPRAFPAIAKDIFAGMDKFAPLSVVFSLRSRNDRLAMTSGKLDPQVLQAICEQGMALHRAGRLDDAKRCYDKVLRRNPKHFGALQLLGVLRLQTGQAEQAVELLKRAVKINPSDPATQDNLGAALSATGHHEAALANHDRALALKPGFVEAHYNRGVALHRLGRPDEALTSYDAAIALAPGNALAHHNRGSVLSALGRPREALASYDRAIALKPDYAEAFNSRGQVLGDSGRREEALASFDVALTLDPGYAPARAAKSLFLLLTGQFKAGWCEYELRKAFWDAAKRLDPERAWSGEGDLAGKRMFLHHEQGLGDSIQFARYVPLLARRAAAVTVCVQAPLVDLLGVSLPGVRVIADSEAPPDFDCHCSLMSLPMAFGTTLETIPPPLRLRSSERRAEFAARLGPKTGPRIGLAWSGNPTHLNDRNRSIAFDQLTPLLGEGIEWIALQNEIRESDADAFAASGRVAFFGGALNDFTAAAALVEQMDLVISVDTSLAHLAGSLGKPVWILLPHAPDWRWLLGRADSPWYPTARLFRQPAMGDWASVIADVKAALRSMAHPPISPRQ